MKTIKTLVKKISDYTLKMEGVRVVSANDKIVEQLISDYLKELLKDDIPYGFGNMKGRDPSDDAKARNQLRQQLRQSAGLNQ